MSPLFRAVGELWRSETMDIAQEHLFSAVARSMLGNMLRRFAAHASAPLLCSQLPQENRTNLAFCLLRCLPPPKDCACSTSRPICQLLRSPAVRRMHARAVVVGAVRGRNTASLGRAIKGIVDALPASSEIWLGGTAAGFAERWRAQAASCQWRRFKNSTPVCALFTHEARRAAVAA